MLDFIWSFSCPTEILGLPFLAFVGLFVGTVLACYEGLRTKFRVVKLKIGNESITFDKKYLVSAVVVVMVVGLTVFSIVEIGLADFFPNTVYGFLIGVVLGFCEGMTTVRTINQRIDLVLKKAGAKVGMDITTQQKLADAVTFEELPDIDSRVNVKFERTDFKNL